MIGRLKDRVVGSTSDLFSHGRPPLAGTMAYPGDHGLLGPESVSWSVIGDAAAFVGGLRALIIQSAHPEVAAGVEQHSRYRDDPLGRLSRTSVYVTETTYGASPEVEAAVAAVRHARRPVHGRSERERAYSAGHPAMAAWVHNVLTDSFLTAHQAYGPPVRSRCPATSSGATPGSPRPTRRRERRFRPDQLVRKVSEGRPEETGEEAVRQWFVGVGARAGTVVPSAR